MLRRDEYGFIAAILYCNAFQRYGWRAKKAVRTHYAFNRHDVDSLVNQQTTFHCKGVAAYGVIGAEVNANHDWHKRKSR